MEINFYFFIFTGTLYIRRRSQLLRDLAKKEVCVCLVP